MGQGSESIGWDDGEDGYAVMAESECIAMRSAYDAAKAAKVGSMIHCPTCRKRFLKRSYQQAFCRNKGRGNCKDRFHNTVSETRRERAIAFSS